MYRFIIIGLILFSLLQNAGAQDRKALAKEITNKMSFMKNGYEKRQIVFRDSLYGTTSLMEIITQKNISIDSIRHLLVDKGFSDFNFELFELKIKNIDEFNEAFIKENKPQLFKLLSDSTFNKVTYSFQKSDDGIDVSLVLSDNQIVIDNEKEGHGEVGPGYRIETITFKGYTKKAAITYYEDNSYYNLIVNRKNQKIDIKLDARNRFKVTVNVDSHSTKYVGIKDQAGNMLSIIKL